MAWSLIGSLDTRSDASRVTSWHDGSMSAPTHQETDADFASRLAIETGQLLVGLREQMFAAGASQWDVKDAGDAAAQAFLADELHTHRPDDAVLSEEEGKTDQRRFDADRVWIIDPLDGTREFSEPGRDDWAVHVALWEKRRVRLRQR